MQNKIQKKFKNGKECNGEQRNVKLCKRHNGKRNNDKHSDSMQLVRKENISKNLKHCIMPLYSAHFLVMTWSLYIFFD